MLRGELIHMRGHSVFNASGLISCTGSSKWVLTLGVVLGCCSTSLDANGVVHPIFEQYKRASEPLAVCWNVLVEERGIGELFANGSVERFEGIVCFDRRSANWLLDGTMGVFDSSGSRPQSARRIRRSRSRSSELTFHDSAHGNRVMLDSAAEARFDEDWRTYLKCSGAFLDGYMFGNGFRSAVELLSASPQVFVNPDGELWLIDGATEFGRVRVWVDPTHGFAMRRMLIDKERSDLFDGKPLSDFMPPEYLPVVRAQYDLTVNSYGEADMLAVPYQGTVEITHYAADGAIYGISICVSRFAATDNDIRSRMDLFVPEGTQVWHKQSPNIDYEWSMGQLKPHVDWSVVKQLDDLISNYRAGLAVQSRTLRLAEDYPQCGLYCVYSLAALHNRHIPFKRLLTPDYLGTAEGSSFQELITAMHDNGLRAKAVSNRSVADLSSLKRRAILHVRSRVSSATEPDHFVVLLEQDASNALILSPPTASEGASVIAWPLSELAARWRGDMIIIDDGGIPWHILRLHEAHLLALGLAAVVACVATSRTVMKLRCFGRERPLLSESASIVTWASIVAIVSHSTMPGWFFSSVGTREVLDNLSRRVYFGDVSSDQIDRLARSGAIFIDARSSDVFNRGHIKGALNIPAGAGQHYRSLALESINRSARIVVYCDPVGCALADRLAQTLLVEDGFENVEILRGDWRNATFTN